MNKTQLVEKLAEEYDFTKVFARDIVDNVFNSLAETIQQGREVSILGFGNFKVAERQARPGRNPRMGEPIKIAASKNTKFKPATSLRASLNAKKRSRSKKARIQPSFP
jgi:DNA-binding protein HU-beta